MYDVACVVNRQLPDKKLIPKPTQARPRNRWSAVVGHVREPAEQTRVEDEREPDHDPHADRM